MVDELKWEYSRDSRLLPVFKVISALEMEKKRLEENGLISAAYGVERSIEVINEIKWIYGLYGTEYGVLVDKVEALMIEHDDPKEKA